FNQAVLPSRTSTPGPHVPGSYPSEGKIDYSRGIALHKGLARAQQNVKDTVVGVGETAKQYLALPNQLASYFPQSPTKSIPSNNVIQSSAVDQKTDVELSINEAAPSIPYRGESSSEQLTIGSQEKGIFPRIRSLNFHSSIQAVDENLAVPFTETNKPDTTYLTPHTNPETNEEEGSLAHTNSITRSLSGSSFSSHSQYSTESDLLHSQQSNQNGVARSGSDGKLGDTNSYDSRSAVEDQKANHLDDAHHSGEAVHTPRLHHQDIPSIAVTDGSSPAFNGLVDPENVNSKPNGISNGVAGIPSSNHEDGYHTSGSEGTGGEFQVSRYDYPVGPLLHTDLSIKAAQHPEVQSHSNPLESPGTKWNGIPLEKPHEKALDDNSDGRLEIGTHNGTANHTNLNPKPLEKRDAHEYQNVRGRETLNVENTGAQRQRSTSVGVNQPNEDQNRSGRPRHVSASGPNRRDAQITKSAAPATINGTNNSSTSKSSTRTPFMDKLRGEMKVISGRLSKDEKKVVEGMRLMGKGA
ncbi:hypothetical protein H0H93_008670, partial [Arthromyces matolae]